MLNRLCAGTSANQNIIETVSEEPAAEPEPVAAFEPPVRPSSRPVAASPSASWDLNNGFAKLKRLELRVADVDVVDQSRYSPCV